MGDERLWGATAEWEMEGPPYNPQTKRYMGPPPALRGVTLHADDANNYDTISMVRDRINTQHPEDMAALADQWYNLATVLADTRDQLLTMSMALAEQGWTSPAARQAFLLAGPGKTLAYLDEWIDAAWRNERVLRAAVKVARQSREDIANLFRRYEQDVHYARHMDVNLLAQAAEFNIFTAHWWDREELREQWNQARDDLRAQEVDRIQRWYNYQARVLARRVADQYVEIVVHNQSGVGPYFRPMDTVINQHGIGAPSVPPLPALPTLTAPTPPGTVPDIEGPAQVPTPGSGQGSAPVPSNPQGPGAPGGAGLPGLPGVPPVLGVPVPVAGTGAQTPAVARLGIHSASGLAGQPGGMPSAPPAAPRGGVLGRSGRRTEDPRKHGPAPSEESFSMPPGSAARPVIHNPRKATSRRGPAEPVGPGIGTEQFPTPPVGAAPPVLGAPGRDMPPVLPPKVRERTTTPAGPAEGDADHLGLGELRSGAARPVVDAAPPAVGVSTDAPAALRAARSTSAGVDPDVPTRRVPPRSATGELEDGRPVTDETAFTVDTPGGAIVAKPREEPAVRSEPPATLTGPGSVSPG